MNNQIDIEKTYSRKTVRNLVKADVDVTSDVYKSCVQFIEDYLNTKYYDSKTKRINELKQHTSITVDDIVLELFASVLPIQTISPIQSVAANLGSRLGYIHLLDNIKTAAEIIAICEPSGLYTIYHSSSDENDTATLGIKAHYSLSDDVSQFINSTMFLPPMLCKPKTWASKDNVGGGYLLGSGSCILGALNHHNKQQNLTHLNTLQSITWELNKYMLEIPEIANKAFELPEQEKQFEVFKDESKEVYEMLLDSGNKFHFGWKYDKRGRSYSTGYHVNLQSTEYKKAILQFSHKEALIC